MTFLSRLLFDIIPVTALVIAIPMAYPWPAEGWEPDRIFNFAEAWLWTLIALGFALAAGRRANKFRGPALSAALAFFVFGISDFVEFHTGAWYRPWTLFLLNALCVLAFLVLLRIYLTEKRREK